MSDTKLDTIYCGDVIDTLRTLPADSVHCIVTSPPYFGLRDYNVSGQIGLEKTPAEYVARMVEVFREARRVLRSDGVLFLNLGDTYASGEVGRHDSVQGRRIDGRAIGKKLDVRQQIGLSTGLPAKNLIGIPWRVAFGLQDDGWILRSEIIWHKPNPMPESVTGRPTKAHETVFLLAKSDRYYYDAAAIAEPAKNWGERDRSNGKYHNEGTGLRPHSGLKGTPRKQDQVGNRRYTGFNDRWDNREEPLLTRNKRTVWTVPVQPFKGAHFATFPPKLIEPMILAGCPAGGVVLDPFMGSGTTALVARATGRHYIGIELNPDYVQMAEARLRQPFMVDMFKAGEVTV